VIYQITPLYKIEIKKFAFGKDFAHMHMEVNMLNKFSVAKVINTKELFFTCSSSIYTEIYVKILQTFILG